MADNNGIPEANTPAPTPADDPIERQINEAIEAQDGKAPVEDTTTETGTSETGTKDANASSDNKDSNSSGSDDKSQQQPNKEGETKPQQVAGAQDLKDKEGNVIAKGGAERRFYEQRETARAQAAHYQSLHDRERNAHEVTRRELENLKQTTQAIHGMDPNSVRIGAQIVTDLQRDPVGTMKKLLAEVVSQGHNIDAIGAGVDTLAIQRLIDERLPQRDTTPQQSEQELLAEAQQEVDAFYGRHPDARPHDALLGRMMRDHPGIDLDTAYFELKNGFAEKGFDWNLSLDDNLKLLSESGSQTPTPTPASSTLPMTNGRETAPNVAPVDEVKIAHEDTDMGDIVRAAMRESGLSVNN